MAPPVAGAPLIDTAEAHARLSSGMLPYLDESRQLDNKNMLREARAKLAFRS